MTFEYPPSAYQAPSYSHSMMGLGDNHGLMYDNHQLSSHMYEMSMTPQGLSTPSNSNGSTTSLPSGERTETKPRLAKDEVARLEKIFLENHKPNSNTKRGLADQMQVDVARINNWFQNRRAKAKQERKQDEFEQRQKLADCSSQEDQTYHVQDLYPENYDLEDHSHSSFSSVCGAPTTSVTSCQPQYDDPAAASLDSYDRSMEAARAAAQQGAFANEQADSSPTPRMSLPENCVNNSIGGDRALFPSSEDLDSSSGGWTDDNGFRTPFALPDYGVQFQAELDRPNNQDPILTFDDFSDNNDLTGVSPLSSNLLPSQLLNPNLNQTNSQAQEDFVRQFEQPEFSKGESNDASQYQPQPEGILRFRSPPSSADIATRRRGVRPAALGTTPRSNSYISPRTVTHSPTINRAGAMSPGQQHMRRIMSAASLNSYVNMNGSRIQKSYPASAQRSPINFKGFADADTFIESNAHNIKRPSIAASVASSVHPPTPMSPNDIAQQLQREMTASSSSSSDDTNRPFDGNTFSGSYFMPSEYEDSKLASPPVTPAFYSDLPQQPHWATYNVTDEPLHTPGNATFGSDPYSWLSSQPNTPGLPPYLQASGFSYNTQSPPQYGLQASASNSNEHIYTGFPSGFVKSSPGSSCSKELLFENHTAKDYEATSK